MDAGLCERLERCGINIVERKIMTEIFLLLVIVGVWYLLQGVILPKLGVPT